MLRPVFLFDMLEVGGIRNTKAWIVLTTMSHIFQLVGLILPCISRGLRIDPTAKDRINPIQPKIIQSIPINSCLEQGLNLVPPEVDQLQTL